MTFPNRMCLSLMIVAALLVCPLLVAQHEHFAVNKTDNIDGAKHPELVPDSTAYRLFFVASSVTMDATPEEKAQQKARLEPIQLSDAELQLVVIILAQFKADYADLINRYNASVAVANDKGVAPNLKGFLQDRDLLVQTTRDALRSALTPESLAHFDAYVQGEKRHMVANKEVQ